MTTPDFSTATQLIRSAVSEGLIPSAALAIGCHDRIFVKETFGQTSLTKEGCPVNETTLYDMASVTKILSTTMIALKMIESGQLALADPISRYFGKLVPADKEPITIFHLMTHTSGLTPHLLMETYISNPEDAISLILHSNLTAAPGEKVQYSCMGYILLGRIVELILGKPLDILSKETVFDPLGMTSTGYHRLSQPSHYAIHANCAFTERDPKSGQWLAGVVHDENCRFLNGVSGNAGVFSNLNDCILYASMLSNLGMTKNGPFLSEATLRAAIHNYTPGMDENRGLGFHLANGYDSYSGGIFDQEAFGHNGFTGPHILVSPNSGLYVILLTNRVHPTRDNSNHLRLRRTLHNVVAVEYSRYLSLCDRL